MEFLKSIFGQNNKRMPEISMPEISEVDDSEELIEKKLTLSNLLDGSYSNLIGNDKPELIQAIVGLGFRQLGDDEKREFVEGLNKGVVDETKAYMMISTTYGLADGSLTIYTPKTIEPRVRQSWDVYLKNDSVHYAYGDNFYSANGRTIEIFESIDQIEIVEEF